MQQGERESRINGGGRNRRSRADGHCMWRKRGVVIFFFGDCDSFNRGRGVSEDNSVVKVFFFLLERAETGVFPPSKSLAAYTRLSWMGKQWNK